MSETTTVSPLRQHVIEDMAARNLNPAILGQRCDGELLLIAEDQAYCPSNSNSISVHRSRGTPRFHSWAGGAHRELQQAQDRGSPQDALARHLDALPSDQQATLKLNHPGHFPSLHGPDRPRPAGMRPCIVGRL
jgi:hypothetical protein